MANHLEAQFKDRLVRQFFDRLKSRVNKFNRHDNKIAAAISPFVIADVFKHFQDEKGPKGKWDPWSRSYSEAMRRRGKGGNQILQDSGRLRQSLSPSNYRGTAKGFEWYNPAKTAGNFPYAAHHDEGKSSARGNSRSFMWLSDKALNKIGKVTLEFLLR